MPAIARATPGDLDPSYGTGGIATAIDQGPPPSPHSYISQDQGPLGVQPGGKVLVGGTIVDGYCFSAGCEASYHYSVERLAPSGALDPSFGSRGITRVDFGLEPNVQFGGAVMQPDGKVLVAGSLASAPPNLVVVRLTAGGALDPSFADDGIAEVVLPDGDYPINPRIAIQDNGKIVVGATSTDDSNQFTLHLARLNGDGTQDLGYGSNGFVAAPPQQDERVSALRIDSQNRLLVIEAYPVGLGEFPDLVVDRYDLDGAPDASFGNQGRVELSQVSASYGTQSTITPSDGVLVLTNQFAKLVALDARGELEQGFGSGGIETVDPGVVRDRNRLHTPALTGLTAQADGKILLAGAESFYGGSRLTLGRLLADGSPDPGFGVGGYTQPLPAAVFDQARILGLPGGGVVMAGSGPRGSLLSARFRSDEDPPNDRDADSIADQADRCPDRFTLAGGCPHARRSRLTLKLVRKKTLAKGELSSDSPSCASGAVVKVLARRPGPDLEVGHARIQRSFVSDGEDPYYARLGHRRRGRLYAVVHHTFDPKVGGCSGVRSKSRRAR